MVRRAGSRGQTPPMPPQRSEASVVAFLAFLGVMAAFGVDASLPAFDEIRPDVGLDQGAHKARTGLWPEVLVPRY